MSSKLTRAVVFGTIVLLLLAGAFWTLSEADRGTEDLPQDENTQSAVLPSDGGTDSGSDPERTTSPESTPDGEGEQQAAPTSDRTDPEQAARAFMQAYPGDVADLVDPTFQASLDGVGADLVDQVSDKHLEHVDQATDDMTEQYAYTVHGTYQGQDIQAYTIVVSRPAEPAEGGSMAENTLEYQVDSFDWSPAMLGDEDDPGPAAGLVSPITAQQRGDLITTTRTGVIAQVLTVDPDESDQDRQARLDEIIAEPTDVTPPMSRSGRYAMRTEITSQYYTTDPGTGGPIQIGYDGTWVDPYDPAHNGSWSLTVTITRDDSGEFIVQSVEETEPTTSNGIDELSQSRQSSMTTEIEVLFSNREDGACLVREEIQKTHETRTRCRPGRDGTSGKKGAVMAVSFVLQGRNAVVTGRERHRRARRQRRAHHPTRRDAGPGGRHRRAGGRAIALVGDAIAQLERELGELRLAVNAAGIADVAPRKR